MSYGGGFGGAGGSFEAIRLAVEASGQGDVQALIDLFGELKQKQQEIDAAYQAANAAAGQVIAAMKAQKGAGYEVITAYDLIEEAVGRATTAAEKEAAATIWMNRQAQALTDTLESLAEHERTAERATVSLTAAQEKAGTASKDAADKGGGYGAMKWLLLSNAVQDVQYGFAAVVNNIPGIVQSFGGSAGIAGAAQFAGVALQILIGKAGALAEMFGKGLPPDYANSVKGLKEELDRLEAKPFKTRIDTLDIDVAKRKLGELTEMEQERDRLLKQRSKAAQERGQRATEAIIEFGGEDDYTGSAARVIKAAGAASNYQEGDDVKDARKRVADTKQLLDQAISRGEADAAVGLQASVTNAEERLERIKDADRKKFDDAVATLVTRAAQGYQADIDRLLDLARKNPDKFAAQGVVEGFVPALADATRSSVEGDASDKLSKQLDAKHTKEHAADETIITKEVEGSAEGNAQDVRRAVQATRAAVEDQLVKSIFDAMKGGATADAAQNQARSGLLSYLRQRPEVDAYARGGAADQLLGDAATKAQNLIDTGGKPKVDAKADAERKKQVDAVVSKAGPAYHDEAVSAIWEGLKAGKDIDEVVAHERPGVEKALGDRGNVDPALVGDAAGAILTKAREAAQNAFDRGEDPKLNAAEGKHQEAASKPFDKTYGAAAANMIARNRLLREQGAPVAHSDRDVDQYKIQGLPFALPEDAARRVATNRVARGLQASGEDPALAGHVVGRAADRVDRVAAENYAITGNPVASLIGVVNTTQNEIGKAQGAMLNLLGDINGLQKKNAQIQQQNAVIAANQKRAAQLQRRGAQVRPSLIQYEF